MAWDILTEASFQSIVFTGMFGLVLSLLLGPIFITFTRRLGLMDYPGTSLHKQHKNPTPLAGGSTLMATIIILVSFTAMWHDKDIRTIVIGAFVIYLFGLADDALGLSAFHKLIGQLLASSILIQAGLSAQFLTRLTDWGSLVGIINWADLGITVFWLVGITNAMNLIDSMDGLVAGINIVTFLFLMIATLLSGQTSLAWLSAGLASSCLALLFYNSTPAKLFLGDSGAQALGFFAAAVAMVYAPKDLNPVSTWFAPILFLSVPIFDTTLVIISRLRRKKPIYTAGLDHSFHRLLSLGLTSKRAVLSLQITSVFLSGLAFILIPLSPFKANLGFGTILLILIVLIIVFEKVQKS